MVKRVESGLARFGRGVYFGLWVAFGFSSGDSDGGVAEGDVLGREKVSSSEHSSRRARYGGSKMVVLENDVLVGDISSSSRMMRRCGVRG